MKPTSFTPKLKLSRIHMLLIVVTICGIAIRFYHLGWNSLWLDEAATLWYASSGYGGVWKYVLSGEYNPPLFYWITTFMLTFGRSEFVLRFIPFVVGAISIPVTYFVGKEWRNEYVGLAAASLLAFSPVHIYYSQEARAYTLVVLWCLLLLYSYLKARRTNSYAWWVLSAVFAALAFWTHFYSFLLIVALFIFSLYEAQKDKDRLKRPLVAGVAYLWFTLPIILATYYLFQMRTSELPTFGLKGIPTVTDLFWNFGAFSLGVGILMFVLFLSGLWLIYKEDKQKAKMIAFVFVFILSITIVASYRIPMVYRYLLYLLPIYLLVISEPLTMFKDKRLSVLCVCGLIVLCSSPLFGMVNNYSKDDWRGFSAYLTERTKDGDRIITCPAYMDLPLKYYYNNTTDKTTLYPGSNITELEWYTSKGTTWYIMTPDVGAVVEARPIPQWLDKNATFVNQWQYYLYLFHG